MFFNFLLIALVENFVMPVKCWMLVQNKIDYNSMEECRKAYPQYSYRTLDAECTEPLLYNFMASPKWDQKICMPVQPLRDQINEELMNVGGDNIKLSLFYIVEGLQRMNPANSYDYGKRYIKLTSPKTVMEKYDIEQISEVGIDIESNIDGGYIINNYRKTLYAEVLLPALFSNIHRDIFIYYDTKDYSIWPIIMHPINLDANFVAQYVLPLHLVYPNYRRLTDIHNSKAPWVDSHHWHKGSLWCRGFRHIVALSDPLVITAYKTIAIKPRGARYCSVSVLSKTEVNILMYLNHVNRTMLQDYSLVPLDYNPSARKPYYVEFNMRLKNSVWTPGNGTILVIGRENIPFLVWVSIKWLA